MNRGRKDMFIAEKKAKGFMAAQLATGANMGNRLRAPFCLFGAIVAQALASWSKAVQGSPTHFFGGLTLTGLERSPGLFSRGQNEEYLGPENHLYSRIFA